MRTPAAHRLYVCTLAATFVAVIAGLLFVSTLLQPYSGDLTRIGGLSEADFGWNAPQFRFVPPNYRQVPAMPERAQPWQIVVFGDSFTDSDRDAATWLDVLVARSGASAIAVRYRSVDQIEAYLRSPKFRTHPPRVMILESVTRNMAYRLAAPDCRHRADATGEGVAVVPIEAGALRQPVENPRRVSFANISERLDVASHFLRQKLVHAVLPQINPVRAYPLARDDLFSARRADQVLYYVSDVEGQRVPDAQVQSFVCTVARLRQAAVANGSTRFLMVPAPDKSVAYAPYAQRTEFDSPGGYEALKSALGADFVDTLPVLRQAIASGVKDVYLPNDSHWGFDGAHAVADAVLTELRAASATRRGGARSTSVVHAARE